LESNEAQELQEHAEHAKHNPSLAPVSLTMAILAVLVAIVSLLGHRSSTEEVLLQSKASDQWAFYQAKNIRRHNDEVVSDLTSIIATKEAETANKVREKYSAEANRYQQEQKEIQSEAQKLEQEASIARKQTDRFDLGEVFLEIGLVITSITLLSGRRSFWHLGIILGLIGLTVALTGFLFH
jgi:Domain of unknown function (DUF4337)